MDALVLAGGTEIVRADECRAVGSADRGWTAISEGGAESADKSWPRLSKTGEKWRMPTCTRLANAVLEGRSPSH